MIWSSLLMTLGTTFGGNANVQAVDRPGRADLTEYYVFNRSPLQPSALVKLPIGAIRPEGWLRHQLELQAEGMMGHLGEISPFLAKEGNAWLSADGVGDHGWEEVPYWLKGYLNTALVLDDATMLDEARIWIEGALASQKEDGWFGPDQGRGGKATRLQGRDDLWPNMIMLFCLQDWYDATGDERVIELMKRYFRYLASVPDERYLLGYWPKMRGGDQLWSIYWLYNRTGEEWLLELAEKNHRNTARWDEGLPNWHNVNIAQCFGEGATWWLQSGEQSDLESANRNWLEVRRLYAECQANLVRVHEELCAMGADLSYPALTAFCRRHGIGHKPPKPEGRYDFPPGKEMQHDTSKHVAHIGGRERDVQTASLVYCYSRLQFFQMYPRFGRFECKLLLDAGIKYAGGAAEVCMIDNTSVVRLRGTGARMVPVPEMSAFGDRYSFHFEAHEVGDANRSARVEGPFNGIERNFLAGRRFTGWEHLNREALLWCDRLNAKFSRKLHASRRELFAAERAYLKPLPEWVPEVYALYHRIVDAEGYVNVESNRYSVPYVLIGRTLEVRVTKDRVEIYDGPREVAAHRREWDCKNARCTDPAHRPPRGTTSKKARQVVPEQEALQRLAPEIAAYVGALKARLPGRGTMGLRRLLQMVRDYPREPLVAAVRTAQHYGLYDLERLERLILRQIGSEYFVLPTDEVAPQPSGTKREDDDEG